MKSTGQFFIILTIASILLAACATLPSWQRPAMQTPYNRSITWQARQQQLQSVQVWQIHGAIGVQTPKQSFSANLVWQQKRSKYQINVFGPLNIGSVQIQGQPNKVSLKLSKGKVVTASTPEKLMQQELGWHLPISDLYYWIRGLPAPNSQYHLKFDRYHHIIDLQQAGWHIQYLRYAGMMSQTDLPVRVYLASGNLRLKIIISRWELDKFKL